MRRFKGIKMNDKKLDMTKKQKNFNKIKSQSEETIKKKTFFDILKNISILDLFLKKNNRNNGTAKKIQYYKKNSIQRKRNKKAKKSKQFQRRKNKNYSKLIIA